MEAALVVVCVHWHPANLAAGRANIDSIASLRLVYPRARFVVAGDFNFQAVGTARFNLSRNSWIPFRDLWSSKWDDAFSWLVDAPYEGFSRAQAAEDGTIASAIDRIFISADVIEQGTLAISSHTTHPVLATDVPSDHVPISAWIGVKGMLVGSASAPQWVARHPRYAELMDQCRSEIECFDKEHSIFETIEVVKRHIKLAAKRVFDTVQKGGTDAPAEQFHFATRCMVALRQNRWCCALPKLSQNFQSYLELMRLGICVPMLVRSLKLCVNSQRFLLNSRGVTFFL